MITTYDTHFTHVTHYVRSFVRLLIKPIKCQFYKRGRFVILPSPEDEYENVFKPFYKVNKGRADSKSSVGLGLSIASDIIRSHGGNIKLVKSSMNGLGVKIFLPV